MAPFATVKGHSMSSPKICLCCGSPYGHGTAMPALSAVASKKFPLISPCLQDPVEI